MAQSQRRAGNQARMTKIPHKQPSLEETAPPPTETKHGNSYAPPQVAKKSRRRWVQRQKQSASNDAGLASGMARLSLNDRERARSLATTDRRSKASPPPSPGGVDTAGKGGRERASSVSVATARKKESRGTLAPDSKDDTGECKDDHVEVRVALKSAGTNIDMFLPAFFLRCVSSLRLRAWSPCGVFASSTTFSRHASSHFRWHAMSRVSVRAFRMRLTTESRLHYRNSVSTTSAITTSAHLLAISALTTSAMNIRASRDASKNLGSLKNSPPAEAAEQRKLEAR